MIINLSNFKFIIEEIITSCLIYQTHQFFIILLFKIYVKDRLFQTSLMIIHLLLNVKSILKLVKVLIMYRCPFRIVKNQNLCDLLGNIDLDNLIFLLFFR